MEQNAQKAFLSEVGGDRRRRRRQSKGSYGIATAASGNSGAGSTGCGAGGDDDAEYGDTVRPAWGHQRSDETLLTGDSLSKVTAAAQAKVPGGTIVPVETDGGRQRRLRGAHDECSRRAGDVYVDKSFNVVSVETR